MELKIKQRIALSALFFQSGLCFSSWASRIPDIKENFNLSESDLGAILLIRPVGSLFGLPLAGFIVDKYGVLSGQQSELSFSFSNKALLFCIYQLWFNFNFTNIKYCYFQIEDVK